MLIAIGQFLTFLRAPYLIYIANFRKWPTSSRAVNYIFSLYYSFNPKVGRHRIYLYLQPSILPAALHEIGDSPAETPALRPPGSRRSYIPTGRASRCKLPKEQLV